MKLDDTVSVGHEFTLCAVLVFGPEWVSYERSWRENRTKFQHFSARAFFAKILKNQDSVIHAILRFFKIPFLKNVGVQICVLRTPGTSNDVPGLV